MCARGAFTVYARVQPCTCQTSDVRGSHKSNSLSANTAFFVILRCNLRDNALFFAAATTTCQSSFSLLRIAAHTDLCCIIVLMRWPGFLFEAFNPTCFRILCACSKPCVCPTKKKSCPTKKKVGRVSGGWVQRNFFLRKRWRTWKSVRKKKFSSWTQVYEKFFFSPPCHH